MRSTEHKGWLQRKGKIDDLILTSPGWCKQSPVTLIETRLAWQKRPFKHLSDITLDWLSCMPKLKEVSQSDTFRIDSTIRLDTFPRLNILHGFMVIWLNIYSFFSVYGKKDSRHTAISLRQR